MRNTLSEIANNKVHAVWMKSSDDLRAIASRMPMHVCQRLLNNPKQDKLHSLGQPRKRL